jgi:hypothetical protein
VRKIAAGGLDHPRQGAALYEGSPQEDAAVIIALGLVASLSLSTAAGPPDGTPAPASQAAPVVVTPAPPLTYAPAKAADQKDDQLVCHTEAVLGSRLPVRRCRTVRDIKERMLSDQQAIDRAQANLQIPGH